MNSRMNRDRRTERGFTLIELLIVVALIAILSCLAIPSMISAMDKGKRSATVANLRQLGHALEAYAIENNRYPEAASMDQLAAALEPEFLSSTPRVDGWGNALVYECQKNGRVFSITAVGKDGQRQSNAAGVTSARMPDDIVFTDGKFVLGAGAEKS